MGWCWCAWCVCDYAFSSRRRRRWWVERRHSTAVKKTTAHLFTFRCLFCFYFLVFPWQSHCRRATSLHEQHTSSTLFYRLAEPCGGGGGGNRFSVSATTSPIANEVYRPLKRHSSSLPPPAQLTQRLICVECVFKIEFIFCLLCIRFCCCHFNRIEMHAVA